MTPEQITEQLDNIIEHIASAHILTWRLQQSMGLNKPASERNVIMEDIATDMTLEQIYYTLRTMERDLAKRQANHLPEHFDRLRRGEA